MAAQDHGRRRRSGLSRLAEGLRGPPLRRSLGHRPAGRGARRRPMDRARPHRVGRLDDLHAGRPPARTAAARAFDQGDPVGARAAARMALLQARGAGDLPDAGADGRQPRGRARRLLRLFRQGAPAALRRRGRPSGRHSAIARAPPARARRQVGPGRPRSRAGARAGARHHRPRAVRQGGQPAGARSKARHAHAGAAPGGMAGRPVARRDRAHDAALRIAERAQPARGRGARPVRRPGADRRGRDRQPQRRRRGLAGRLGLSSAAPARSIWCAPAARPARR